MKKSYPITKKKILAAMKCLRAAWLYIWAKKVGIAITPPTNKQLRMMNSGIEAENYYRKFYSDGILVEDGKGWSYNNWEKAMISTMDSISRGAKRLFQSAFVSNDNILSLSDEVTITNDKKLILNEIKATNRVKQEHMKDVAVQVHTIIDSGYELEDVRLTHLNRDAILEDGENFFISESITDAVFEELPKIQHSIKVVKELSNSDVIPEPEYQKACYDCDWRGHCLNALPEPNILTVPNIHINRIKTLQAKNILDARNIPEQFPLTGNQEKYIQTLITGEPYINLEAIREELENLIYPHHYMDFETYSYSLPIVPNTGPWEQVPFQWSIHHLENSGDMYHDEFLYLKSLKSGDLRLEFLTSLLDKLENDNGSIVVYNAGFEKSILKNLAKRYPEYADRISDLINRIWDLEIIFKHHFIDPRFLGKSSLKVVVPALMPECDYEKLAISNGVDATIAWSKMMQTCTGVLSSGKMSILFEDAQKLLAYCAMDTLVMVKLFDYLEQLLLQQEIGQLELPLENQNCNN